MAGDVVVARELVLDYGVTEKAVIAAKYYVETIYPHSDRRDAGLSVTTGFPRRENRFSFELAAVEMRKKNCEKD